MPEPYNTTNWKFHAEHDSLVSETHARPSQPVAGPAEVLHLALKCSAEVADMFFSAIDEGTAGAGSRHKTGKIGNIKIKLEKHTEFLSCTLFQEQGSKNKMEDLFEVLNTNFPIEQSRVFILLRLSIVKSASAMLKILPIDQRIYGGCMCSSINVRSTFIPDQNDTVQFVLHASNPSSHELGRRLQRIIEMETYRTMSLLGLSVARHIGGELLAIEQELEELTLTLKQTIHSSQQEDEEVFKKLSDLSQRNNILSTETKYRFAASRAYFALFQQRVDSLEETKAGDLQTMSGFLRSRLEPAMATMESTAKRQETLTNDLSRAIALLRTRIELNLNKGNQALLRSMDKRHNQQLKISQTVEGLSIVAITYYAVGLVSYLFKALAKQPWMPFSATFLTAVSVPFVLVFVWRMLHRLRQSWEAHK